MAPKKTFDASKSVNVTVKSSRLGASLSPRDVLVPEIAVKKSQEGITALSAMVTSKDMTVVSGALDQLYLLEKAIEAVKDLARKKLLAQVLAQGEQSSEAGSKKWEVGDWELEARVRDTGFDDAKVEQFLKSKGQLPSAGMDATVKYKTNPTKLASCGFNQEEVDACLKEKQFVLQQPRKRREPPDEPSES